MAQSKICIPVTFRFFQSVLGTGRKNASFTVRTIFACPQLSCARSNDRSDGCEAKRTLRDRIVDKIAR